MADIIVGALIVAYSCFVIHKVIQDKKNGRSPSCAGCSGGGCGGSCAGCAGCGSAKKISK